MPSSACGHFCKKNTVFRSYCYREYFLSLWQIVSFIFSFFCHQLYIFRLNGICIVQHWPFDVRCSNVLFLAYMLYLSCFVCHLVIMLACMSFYFNCSLHWIIPFLLIIALRAFYTQCFYVQFLWNWLTQPGSPRKGLKRCGCKHACYC